MRLRPPDQRHQIVEEQDQPERAEHLIEMAALIERSQCQDIEDDTECHRGDDAEHDRQDERAGPVEDGRGEERAHHIERAMCQIEEVHDAEDQREPGRHQEQHDAELHPVQQLLDKKRNVHSPSPAQALDGSPRDSP